MTDSCSPVHSLFTRNPRNPLLTAADWPHTVNAVFNPGAVRLKDGTTLLLCRVEDRRGISSLWAARSSNGVDKWEIDAEPTLAPEPDKNPEEVWGVEDPRIVWLEEIGKYAITYTAYSQTGPAVSMALTEDFRAFERLRLVLAPEDKDAALLPRRYRGCWLIIHRPVTGRGSADIWVAESPDLYHWGKHQLLLAARRGAWWDASKIGLATPLIETERGWLMLYHGVRATASGSLYRLGVALLDLADPRRCLMRSDEWVFGPCEAYERQGDVAGVVFPCGYTIGDDGDTVNIYYGAADTCIGLATGRISEILNWLDTHGEGGSEHNPII
jgi:predicted GH43/DUF377 family glycosyl hydrolase